jgi:tetratricopeptide (TPR) repeat protein
VRPSTRSHPWLAAALLLILACTPAEERYARHLERAEEYVAQGLTSEALLELQSALKIRPQDAMLHERIGDVQQARGDSAEARRYYQQAVRLDDGRISAAMSEARLSIFDDPERAHELLKLGLERAPELALVHRTRSYIALVDGDTMLAIQAADRAVKLDPEEIANWAEFGTALQGRIAERQMKGLPPRAWVFRSAIAAYDRIDELEDGYPRARLEKARILAVWPGHRKQAERTYAEALTLAKQQGSPVEIRLAARAMHSFGVEVRSTEIRRRALRELVELDEDDFDSWEMLGRLTEGTVPGRGESVYLELLEKRPDDPRAHLLYSSYLLRENRADEAEAHLRTRLEAELDHAQLWGELVRVEIQRGRLAKADAAYRQMSEKFPDDFATAVAKARLALISGQAGSAALQLRELVDERESYELQRLLALAELMLNNPTAAQQAIDRATMLARTRFHTAALKRLEARIAFLQRDWPGVLVHTRYLIERRMSLSDAEKVRLATALHHTDQLDESRAVLEELLAKAPPPPAAVIAFAELEGERDPERARAELEAAHQRAPGNPDLLEMLTKLELREKQPQQALARINQVVGAGIAVPKTLMLRAKLLVQMGAYENAEADVLRAFEANPMLPDAIDLLFAIYEIQGRLDEVRRSFEQAEEAGVLHSGARLLLARLYVVKGDNARARAMLERVIEEHPQLWAAKNDLAYTLAEEGEDLDHALALALEAHTASGFSASTADTVGMVHLAADRPQEALDQFHRAVELAQDRSEEDGQFPEAEEARRQLEAARHPEAGSSS